MINEIIEFTDTLLDTVQKSTLFDMTDAGPNLIPYTEWAKSFCNFLGGEVAAALVARQPQITFDANSEQYILTDPGSSGVYGFHRTAGEDFYEHYLPHDPRTVNNNWPSSGHDKCYTSTNVQNEFSDWLKSSDLQNLGFVLSFAHATKGTSPPPGIAIYPKRGNTQSAEIIQRAQLLKPIIEHAFNIHQKIELLQSELYEFDELLPDPTAFFNKGRRAGPGRRARAGTRARAACLPRCGTSRPDSGR